MRSLTKPRVIVIGELNVDIVATDLVEPPQMGAEILANDLTLRLGSASAIFACGIAKLGHEVTLVSQVGKDVFGDFCLSELRSAGISTRNVFRRPELRTGATLALSTRKERALVTYRGAIATFGYKQLRMSMLKGHRHLHMTSYFLQAALRPAFPRIFREARLAGLSTSFDPNSDPAHTWTSKIGQVLAHTDILFLNKSEALQLTRARGVRSALKKLGSSVPCAVIKLGRKGAVAIRSGEIVAVDSYKVQTLDTTGAGDSFAAGFVAAYLRGNSLIECLRSGNACGALSTRNAGGTAGQPDTVELKNFLRRSPS
ncbi:MAG TPA: carbohydrate kinase family protein [Pyrinomonadaceae bacterium]|nr:carbohydrate kinase family protein [Pyrinomonadaceae bacterium]